SAATANTWILVATAGFGSLPGGVTPDYILPANFLNTGGGTLNYASGIQIWNYGALPIDGVHSLARDGSINVNSPHNFTGQSGSVGRTQATPMMGSWGVVLLVGALLFIGSGLLRRRQAQLA